MRNCVSVTSASTLHGAATRRTIARRVRMINASRYRSPIPCIKSFRGSVFRCLMCSNALAWQSSHWLTSVTAILSVTSSRVVSAVMVRPLTSEQFCPQLIIHSKGVVYDSGVMLRHLVAYRILEYATHFLLRLNPTTLLNTEFPAHYARSGSITRVIC